MTLRFTSLWPLAAALGAALAITFVATGVAADAVAVTGAVGWGWFIAVVACMALFLAIYATAWWLLLVALVRRPVSARSATSLFVATWPGRYIPGSLAYHGGRLLAAPRLGVSRATVAASLVYENLAVLASSGAVASVFLVIGMHGELNFGFAVLATCVAWTLCVVMLQPPVMRFAARALSTRSKRLEALEDFVLDYRVLAPIVLLYGGGAVVSGLAYYFALLAFDAHTSVFVAIAAYNLAGIAGMLALAVPGGLGVREAVVVGVMASAVTIPLALNAALFVRGVALLVDLSPLVAISVLGVLGSIARRRNSLVGRRHASE